MNCLHEEKEGQKADKHVTSRRCIRKKADRYLIRKVRNQRSFFYVHHKSEHKTWVLNSVTNSVMLLFTSETFQQNVQQESFDTIRLSCTEDHHIERVDERTAKLYREQGYIDITALVVLDEMTQCEACKKHNASKGKSFCTRG